MSLLIGSSGIDFVSGFRKPSFFFSSFFFPPQDLPTCHCIVWFITAKQAVVFFFCSSVVCELYPYLLSISCILVITSASVNLWEKSINACSFFHEILLCHSLSFVLFLASNLWFCLRECVMWWKEYRPWSKAHSPKKGK